MHKQIQLLFFVLLLTNSHLATSQTYAIKGTVQQTSPYCGGAKPTQEIIENLAIPKPFANKLFYIRQGKKNNTRNKILKKFTTDSNGNFSFKLPKGVYSIIVEEQLQPIKSKDYINRFQTVDDSCLQAWWQKPYYVLIVQKNNKPLLFTFHHRCYINNDIPCITYTGPKHP